MEQAVETPGSTATGTGTGRVDAVVDAALPPAPESAEKHAEEQPDGQPDGQSERKLRRPDWWHRDHPVFVPLAGFFTGMVYVIVIPGAYAAVLKSLVGYERAEELFPFVLLTLVVPIALLAPRRTRRFGGYMLFGVLATAVVVISVALAVLYVLLARDG